MDWRNAGRSLKGFGFVPEVTACALTVWFRVGKARVPFIDRLGFVPKRYCVDFVGNQKYTKHNGFLAFSCIYLTNYSLRCVLLDHCVCALARTCVLHSVVVIEVHDKDMSYI